MPMELALGTVQFGLNYGIAGRGEPVPENEIRAILETASECGVGILDTAPAYGDIEPRLAKLCAGLPFKIISKIPTVPAELDAEAAAKWALASAIESRERLGTLLDGLLFHTATDLAGERGQAIWQTVNAWTRNDGLKLGVSCYAPEEGADLHKRFGIAMAQMPGNALDQRLQSLQQPAGFDVHLRSAFLQGLLLMPEDDARKKLPNAAKALQRWHAWCKKTGLSPLQGALSVVKTYKPVSAVVVGVDNPTQFLEIAAAWEQAKPMQATDLVETDLAVIDPRRWSA